MKDKPEKILVENKSGNAEDKEPNSFAKNLCLCPSFESDIAGARFRKSVKVVS